MATVTYYFDSNNSAVDFKWEFNPNNMTDGNTGTRAISDTPNETELCLTNTCPGTNLGTITKVEIRVMQSTQGTGDPSITGKLTPVFGGSDDGDDHTFEANAPHATPAYTSWFDITSDTNAPGTWAWSDVTGLDMKVTNVDGDDGSGNGMEVYIVEVRITYQILVTTSSTTSASSLLTLQRARNYDTSSTTTFSETLSAIRGAVLSLSDNITTSGFISMVKSMTINISSTITTVASKSIGTAIDTLSSINISETLSTWWEATLNYSETIITSIVEVINVSWENIGKHITSWTGGTKNSTTWTDETKHDA